MYLRMRPPLARVRRSQTLLNGSFFDCKNHSLFCNESASPWTRDIQIGGVRQCQTYERPGTPTFRDIIVEKAKHRNEQGRNVTWNIGEVDLPARDAQYPERCYNSFKTIPKLVDLSPSHVVDDDALQSCINVMYAHQCKLYNTTDLCDMYLDYGSKLSHKQMPGWIIRCDGCASLVLFKEFVGKMMRLVKASSDEEESEVDTSFARYRKRLGK